MHWSDCLTWSGGDGVIQRGSVCSVSWWVIVAGGAFVLGSTNESGNGGGDEAGKASETENENEAESVHDDGVNEPGVGKENENDCESDDGVKSTQSAGGGCGCWVNGNEFSQPFQRVALVSLREH